MSLNVVHNAQATTGPPLRIAHLVPAGPLRRLGPMIHGLLTGLQERGLDAVVVSESPSIATRLLGEDASTIKVRDWHAWSWRLRRRARRIARQLHVDLIHSWDLRAVSFGMYLAEEMRVPHLVHFSRGRDIEAVAGGGELAVDRIVVMSPKDRAALERVPSFSGLVTEMPPALPFVGLVPPQRSERVLPSVAWIGSFDGAREPLAVLDALLHLRDAGHDFQAVLVGHGAFESRVRRVVRERGLNHCCSVAAAAGLESLALRGADVVLRPQQVADLDVAPLFAMAQRSILIAAVSPREPWLVAGETAVPVGSGRRSELLAELTAVVGNLSAYASLAESAERYVREHHGMLTQLPAWDRLYRAVSQREVPSRIGEALS